MAKFIAISGPCSTGKSTLVSELRRLPEFSGVIKSPDIQDTVWNDLVKKRIFQDFTEISTDSNYMCTFLMRMVDYYNRYIEAYKDTDTLVLLDGCWIDLSIYSLLNMWYSRIVKSVQEEILSKISKYNDDILKVYITNAADELFPVEKLRLRGKITTFRMNRPLEIQYYELAKNYKNAVSLPTTDVRENAKFVLEDLRKLGYL